MCMWPLQPHPTTKYFVPLFCIHIAQTPSSLCSILSNIMDDQNRVTFKKYIFQVSLRNKIEIILSPINIIFKVHTPTEWGPFLAGASEYSFGIKQSGWHQNVGIGADCLMISTKFLEPKISSKIGTHDNTRNKNVRVKEYKCNFGRYKKNSIPYLAKLFNTNNQGKA